MPIVKIAGKLVYYSHVPKCGGSAVEGYLHSRFGTIGLLDPRFMAQPEAQRWSRTSPQHIDLASLRRLFPSEFFDHCFAVVRHPVERIVSVFHFQRDVEKLIPSNMGFSEWLSNLQTSLQENPFQYDNHLRPMTELVPENAKIFHLEHGLDSLVPWFDEMAGDQKQPRSMPLSNERGAYSKVKIEKAVPTSKDTDIICRLYKTDFSRFGYKPGKKLPDTPPPFAADGSAKPVKQVASGDGLVKKTMARVKRQLGI
jgi:Sulfotransferase family